MDGSVTRLILTRYWNQERIHWHIAIAVLTALMVHPYFTVLNHDYLKGFVE